MLYVKITKEEALSLGSSRNYGITSGKKINGVRETIYFCSNLIFIKNFEREKELIEI